MTIDDLPSFPAIWSAPSSPRAAWADMVGQDASIKPSQYLSRCAYNDGSTAAMASCPSKGSLGLWMRPNVDYITSGAALPEHPGKHASTSSNTLHIRCRSPRNTSPSGHFASIHLETQGTNSRFVTPSPERAYYKADARAPLLIAPFLDANLTSDAASCTSPSHAQAVPVTPLADYVWHLGAHLDIPTLVKVAASSSRNPAAARRERIVIGATCARGDLRITLSGKACHVEGERWIRRAASVERRIYSGPMSM
eukprot:CAMPEP_0169373270 /NCGR_PEP_ID=MMETSP1017-20121227/36914_1 /TAXON_ID=342587 /ORGANISM="Karlodinium micrum, Strain CCMP2283" /LENGTH=252 /DNA_ID=CAMNT_0009471969 /DNA_START=55 /DNA_END=811 /DNA_ORIENTATION=+